MSTLLAKVRSRAIRPKLDWLYITALLPNYKHFCALSNCLAAVSDRVHDWHCRRLSGHRPFQGAEPCLEIDASVRLLPGASPFGCLDASFALPAGEQFDSRRFVHEGRMSMKGECGNRDPRRGLPSAAERRKTNAPIRSDMNRELSEPDRPNESETIWKTSSRPKKHPNHG